MTTHRSNFYVDEVPITVPNVRWVTSDQKLHGAQNIDMAHVSLPGRDGELPIPSTRSVGAAEWDLTVAVTGRDYASLMANKAALDALFSPVQRSVQIREDMKDASGAVVRTLFADGMLSGMSVGNLWNSPTDGVEITYTFRIPGGCWVELETSFTITGPNSSAVVMPSAVGGSAPQYMVRVEFMPTSPSATFSMTPSGNVDSSLSFYGDGTVTTGQQISIHARTLHAMQNGKSVEKYLDSGPTQFHINPDGAVWVPTFSGISSMTVYTRKAWY